MKQKFMKNKNKKKTSKKPLKNSPNSMKRGAWTEAENNILLASPSNFVASILLNRDPKHCSHHRYILVKEGRKSIKVERMNFEKAKKVANELVKNNVLLLENKPVILSTQPVNNNNNNNIECLTPVVIQDPEGLVLVLNGNEMFFKTYPKKLIIKGSSITIE